MLLEADWLVLGQVDHALIGYHQLSHAWRVVTSDGVGESSEGGGDVCVGTEDSKVEDVEVGSRAC